MMGRIWLRVLCLSGWNISTCLLLHLRYVADPKTWTEAQAYCREKYTDLATITNNDENNQLRTTSSGSEVWIGLYSLIDWRWSDGYNGNGAGYRSWDPDSNEPDIQDQDQFCVAWLFAKWAYFNCQSKFSFICNDGTLLNPEFVIVEDRMTWSSAQRYCREKYMDLATVRSYAEEDKILNLLMNTKWLWIGLFRDPNLFWSDGRSYAPSNRWWWSNSFIPIGSMNVSCASSSFEMKSCETRLPFVCYSTPVRQQVVKLKIKDSSVDLNDPAVKANLLKKIQDRLMEKGVSGVTLKWREQPDGNVFHKEGKKEKQKKLRKTEF